MTGRELVEACLRKIGARGPGESISNDEAQEGLEEINRMINSWANKKLMIYAITEETFSLIASTASYTLGSGATWNTTRPQWIDSAVIRDGSIDYPIDIKLSEKEFSQIAYKSVTSPYPYALYDDGGYPNRTITLYPVPSATHSIVLWTAKPISEISTLNTTIAFPPGYEDALVWNGAERFADEYGKPVTPTILKHATESKAAIKRANFKPKFLEIDPNIPGQGRRFNIYSGETR